MPQMIIANRLVDGVVVFFASRDAWVPEIDAGLVFDDAAEGQRLFATAKEHEARCLVIDPNLIDVEITGGHYRPVAIREAIRAFGPTVRTDLDDVSVR